MCTLTWWGGSAGPGENGRYEVFFNRDESKDRPVASPPEISETNGVRFLAPRDPVAGGTWLLANEFGVTIALLNWYSRQTAAVAASEVEKTSRGKLVWELGPANDPASLERRLAGFDPVRFRPFRLLAFFPEERGLSVCFWRWSGRGGGFEQAECPPMPVCSSSFDRSAVIESRETRFAEALREGLAPDRLRDYHHNFGSPAASAYTVRMNRPDAQTWSISRVSVDTGRIRFRYEAEAPDLAGDPEVHESSLERIR